MKIQENVATIFLGIYLIVAGAVSLLGVHHSLILNLLPLVALVTGILFLLGSGKLNKSVGVFILGVWLILKGLTPFIYVHIPYFAVLIDILAVVAGILILLRK